MNTTGNNTRIQWIDKAKGIAILLVIAGHVSGGLKGIWDLSFVYGIHLTMFFLLSGYLFKPQPLTKEYVSGKFRRLMVPYFYTCAAIIAMNIFQSLALDRDFSTEAITRTLHRSLLISYFASGSITDFGSIHIGSRIGAIWFLPAMFFALILFQMILALAGGSSFKSGAAAICSAAVGMISAKFIWLPFSIQSALFAVFFLWAGYEIRQRGLTEKVRLPHYLAAQIILLLGIRFKLCTIYFVTASMADPLLSVPVGLSGCLLIYLLSKITSRRTPLSFLGENSLIIMCTHLFTLTTMKRFLNGAVAGLRLQGNPRIWGLILFHILTAVILAIAVRMIGTIHERLIGKLPRRTGDQAYAADITAGILLIAVVLSNQFMYGGLRNVINSCALLYFVFYAGYRFHKEGSFLSSVVHLMKVFLGPYLLCFIFSLVLNFRWLNGPFFLSQLRKYLLCYSANGKILPDTPTVGPIYLLPLLFCSGFLYTLICTLFRKNSVRISAVFLISAAGFTMGKSGILLPWNFDAACFSLLFYALGVQESREEIFGKYLKNDIYYFVLSTLWVYMIYAGSMDLSTRDYGKFGVTAAGAAAGIFLILRLAAYTAGHLPPAAKLLHATGRAIIFVFIIRELAGDRLNRLLDAHGLPQDQVLNPLLTAAVILGFSIAAGAISDSLLRRIRQVTAAKAGES